MKLDPISAADIGEWLRRQELIYASFPVSGDKRLRLVYAPYRQTWEVTVGIGGVNDELYVGSQLTHAVAAFNRAVSEHSDLLEQQ